MSEPLQSMTIPPQTFGDGWLTKNAADLCKIAIAFGGFDGAEIVWAITKIQGRTNAAKANMATVEKALQLISDLHQTPEEKAAKQAAFVALKVKFLGA